MTINYQFYHSNCVLLYPSLVIVVEHRLLANTSQQVNDAWPKLRHHLKEELCTFMSR